MISYWYILSMLAIGEVVIASWLLLLVWRARRIGPIGRRLAGIAAVFVLQAIVSLWAYVKWMNAGYGKDVSGPLLLYHFLIVVGLALLFDIVRR